MRQEVQLEARETEARRAQLMAERRAVEAEAALDEAERLAGELESVRSAQTERGLVLTLGDVLFDTNEAALKDGASPTLDRLARFMDENPDRRLLIEGHTDSRGTDEYNRQLSGERAQSVADALSVRGIAGDRLRTAGLGEDFPVASNDAAAGRQQNRRVEIVVSDAEGAFPVSAEQRAASGGRQ
jgi:outer membrane protein OmpA-like peptidoglycan-associated protein